MPRGPKAAEYERRARVRKLYDIQANMNGWEKIDVMRAYMTPDEQVVLFDNNERRLTGEANLFPAGAGPNKPLVEPDDIPATEFGPRWESGHEKMAKGLAALSLSSNSHDAALKGMEQIAASLLRGIELLREYNGPDWREQIGLEG